MPIDIRKYLKHTCQFQKMGETTFGDPNVTSTVTAQCFSYFGTAEAVASKRQFTTKPGWTVILPNSFSSYVAVGDRILQLRDDSNDLLIEQGTVSLVTVYRHHLYRTQFVQVQVELQ